MGNKTTSFVVRLAISGTFFAMLCILTADASAANLNYTEDSNNFDAVSSAKSCRMLHRLLNWEDKDDGAGDEKDDDKNGDDDSEDELKSDRPNFTQGSSVVPKKHLQIESGYTFTQAEGGDKGHNTHDLPELQLRYGLAERLELRLYWEGIVFNSMTDRAGHVVTENGGTDIDLGFKYALTKQKSWRPESALIVNVSAPVGSVSQSSNQVDADISYNYSWELTKRVTLAGSTGNRNTFESNDHLSRFYQSADLEYKLTEKLSMFNEWYVLCFKDSNDNHPQHYYDGGFTYLVTPRFQLDWRAGVGLSQVSDGFFTGCGFTFLR